MASFQELFANQFSDYLRDLELLTNIDCGTYNKHGVDRVVEYMRERAKSLSLAVAEYPQHEYGDCLYLKAEGRGGARIFMIGHADTVYPDGTVEQYPFRRQNGRIYGPGSSDMKAGLLAGLYAIRLLLASGFRDFSEIGLFVNSEEEIGSPVSRQIYPEIVLGADAALVLEAARSNGDIVSGRKGSGLFRVQVSGRAAHAGVDPAKGANAIVALSHYIPKIAALNGLREGLTVNVGIVNGGTRANVVPDTAEAVLDVRVVQPEDVSVFEDSVRQIVSEVVVPGTKALFSGSIGSPPMPKTETTARLVDFAQRAAGENGFQVKDVFTGGASDGNMIAGVGVPVLDGLGPVGGHGHNAAEEYVLEDSISPRVAMVARLIQLIAENQRQGA